MQQKVLLVEDEFIVAKDLSMLLEKEGYEVCGIASTADQGLALTQERGPDLVILDIQLQGKKTGIDLAMDLRRSNIPYIYLSANSNRQTLEAAKQTEPYAFLVKPFREKDLLIALEIARYRHQHNTESTLKRVVMLQEQLSAIVNDSSNSSVSPPALAISLQHHIPFDVLIVYRKSTLSFDDAIILIRSGFDEYQVTGLDGLSTISKLKTERLATFFRSIPGGNTCLLDDEFDSFCSRSVEIGIVADAFQICSCITFQPGDSDFHLLFCSKRSNSYGASHLELLGCCKGLLRGVLNEIFQTRPIFTKGTDRPRPGENISDSIIGNSASMLEVLDQVSQVAPLDTAVLILGESGTGKEVVANAIHAYSSRKNKKLVKVNCGAIPQSLIDSELFGHEKGAFTGATERRTGKFEQANGGSIFLDEIGEMPVELQSRLLRVLQEKEIDPIGSKGPVPIDVRVIAATNKNLENEISAGRFRLDLFYRLNVFPIVLPPLRERRQDIVPLANYFAATFCSKINKPFNGLSKEMTAQLEGYHWPGNIRELQNVIEQATILNDGRSPLQLTRKLITDPKASLSQIQGDLIDIKLAQQESEREYITTALRKSRGRVRGEGGAAQLLNIKPTTLESKMEKLGLRKEQFSVGK